MNPTGTLYEHFEYSKKTLRKAGILAPSNKHNDTTQNAVVQENPNIIPPGKDQCERKLIDSLHSFCQLEFLILELYEDTIQFYLSLLNLNFTDEIKNALSWLESYIEPLQKVISYWNLTFNSRRHLLTVEHMLVHEYYARFPILSTSTASELVSSTCYKILQMSK